jgi:RimJ/RimL family protein N-acetyltransferase
MVTLIARMMAGRFAAHNPAPGGYPCPMPDQSLIRSERLDLRLLSLAQLDEVAAGDLRGVAAAWNAAVPQAWLEEVRWLAGRRAAQVRARPSDAPWLLRALVLRGEGGARDRVIGYLNFHAGPDEAGRAEIGYTLLPEEQGHGYAIEAVRAAFDWATRVHGVTRFRASVSPDNQRSRNLVTKLGFHQTGEQWDEVDGLELVYELDR